MKSFRENLSIELKDSKFKEYFSEEQELLKLSMKIIEERNKLGMSQSDLARKSHITQQQVSKVENGVNCNIFTFLKICYALGIKISLSQTEKKAV